MTFDEELRDHLETWGPHCGAPLNVYAGHLRNLILSAQIDELEQLGQWVRDGRGYDPEDARDEIARAIENRCRALQGTVGTVRFLPPRSSKSRI